MPAEAVRRGRFAVCPAGLPFTHRRRSAGSSLVAAGVFTLLAVFVLCCLPYCPGLEAVSALPARSSSVCHS
ncbi:MAG: hypothetical protein ACRDTX_26635 [Pseudonocardiaceae bacterium]